jgi:hypothetical protein
MATLRTALTDWTDIDGAAHVLAQCLGVVPSGLQMQEIKWVYWSSNPLGNMLYRTLDRLAELGVLEKREEPDLQYRWCSAYRIAPDGR